jgi:O-antigen/teichoic acid export membrane protein
MGMTSGARSTFSDAIGRLRGSQLAVGSLVVFGIQVAATIVRYAANVVFARLGGAGQFGYFSFASAWVQLLVAPAAIGLTFSVLRFIPTYQGSGDHPRLRGLVRRGLQVTAGGSVAIAAAGILIAALIPMNSAKRLVLVVALATLPILALVNIYKEMTRSTKRMLPAYGFGELLPPAAVLLCTAAAVLAGVRMTAVTMTELTAAGFAAAMVLQRLGLRYSLGRLARSAKPAFETGMWMKVSLPLFVLAVVNGFMNRSDILFVGIFRSAAETGAYSAASRTASLVSFVLGAVLAILAPMISSAHADGRLDDLRDLVVQAVRWSTALSLVVVAVQVVFAAPIMAVFGGGFSSGVLPLRILAIAEVVNAATGPVGVLLALTGSQSTVARISATCLFLSVVAYVFVVPHFGTTGAAVVAGAVTIVWNGWLYVVVRKRFGFRLYGLV